MNAVVAALVASTAVAAMQKALDSSAEWTMERRIGGSGKVLVSSGTVRCEKDKGIVWHVKEPFESSVEMTPDSMVLSDDDGVVVKPLAQLPRYAEVRRAVDAFAGGDTNAFSGVFSTNLSEFPDGGWRMTVKPESRAMRRLVTEVEISGAALPTNVVLTSPSGVSVVRFRESSSAK